MDPKLRKDLLKVAAVVAVVLVVTYIIFTFFGHSMTGGGSFSKSFEQFVTPEGQMTKPADPTIKFWGQ